MGIPISNAAFPNSAVHMRFTALGRRASAMARRGCSSSRVTAPTQARAVDEGYTDDVKPTLRLRAALYRMAAALLQAGCRLQASAVATSLTSTVRCCPLRPICVLSGTCCALLTHHSYNQIQNVLFFSPR
jgi:hypothetical protein